MNKSQSILDRLIPYMLTNYNYVSGKGLAHGEMGGVLFFAMYAKYSGIIEYGDYSDMLMENVYGNLSRDMVVSFDTGLCGVGWCVEYLVRNDLVEGNTDEILEDIDKKVMETDPCRMQDMSFGHGLGGILFYVISRMKSFDRGSQSWPFDDDYLKRLHKAVNIIGMDLPAYLITEFNRIMEGDIDFTTKPILPSYFFDELPENIDVISNHPLGIVKGLTGIALKQIMQ